MATRDKTRRRARLIKLCAALPETSQQGEQHLAFKVRKKNFAYYLDDHHGDAIVALCCKAAPGNLETLMRSDPERYYKPAYLGPKGWVGLRLDLDVIDWDEVEELVHDAYRLIAPKRLTAQLEP